jgi:hypothetical protein
MDEALELVEAAVLAWVELLAVVSLLEMMWRWLSRLQMLCPSLLPMEMLSQLRSP